DSALGSLELGEVELPHLVRGGGVLRECRPAVLSQLPALFLVLGGQQQPLITHGAQHRGLRDHMPLVAYHRPHLAVSPFRLLTRVLDHQRSGCLPRGTRPGPLRRVALAGLGLPATVSAFGHADEFAEPRGRHARLGADHLEVLKGPSRPSALFFHTRTSIAASPNAWVRSATSSSSCCSREEGLDLPVSRPSFPPSRNCRFQFPIACSETFSRRAASATVISPCNTASTIRSFFSNGILGGRLMIFRPFTQG